MPWWLVLPASALIEAVAFYLFYTKREFPLNDKGALIRLVASVLVANIASFPFIWPFLEGLGSTGNPCLDYLVILAPVPVIALFESGIICFLNRKSVKAWEVLVISLALNALSFIGPLGCTS